MQGALLDLALSHGGMGALNEGDEEEDDGFGASLREDGRGRPPGSSGPDDPLAKV